jgi:hypothetical protein
LLLTDRVWLERLTAEGEHPARLDAILFEDRREEFIPATSMV